MVPARRKAVQIAKALVDGFRERKPIIAVLAYGTLNAILYAGLTPLWDGFDEPFHYGYVQSLSNRHVLPTVGVTTLSAEIAQSLPLAPASHLVQRNVPAVMTFSQYYLLPSADRLALRRQLDRLDPGSAEADSGHRNYEALQAPLAYVLLAPFDRLWAQAHVPSRILLLRLVCGVSSALATAMLTLWLGTQLGLSRLARISVVFLLFSCQMFYGTTAHVANDWLAIPLFTLVLASSVSLYRHPDRSSILIFASALAAGLLTKAYFLSVVPVACGLVSILYLRRRLPLRHAALFPVVCGGLAAPWYARNLILYKNLTAMQESGGGISPSQLFRAGFHLPWARSALMTARASLWNGNNSGTTFHATTITLMLLLLLAGGCLYLGRIVRRNPPAPEFLAIAVLLSYSVGLAYCTVLTFSFTHGVGIAPSPWYVQVLFPPGLCLMLIGLSKSGMAGRILWIAILWLWAYVISATYVAKLIPLYGGISAGPARFATLRLSYRTAFGQMYDNLGTISLLPAGVLLYMTALVVASALALAIGLSFRILARDAY